VRRYKTKEARLKLADSILGIANKLFYIPLVHLVSELYIGLDTHWSTYIVSFFCLLIAYSMKHRALNIIETACEPTALVSNQ